MNKYATPQPLHVRFQVWMETKDPEVLADIRAYHVPRVGDTVFIATLDDSYTVLEVYWNFDCDGAMFGADVPDVVVWVE